MPSAVRNFDPGQIRDPDGTWGDGMPGPDLPDFDTSRFEVAADVDGTFGQLVMGYDNVGDVLFAFHEHTGTTIHAREMELGSDELADLADALESLADQRDEAAASDTPPGHVFDAVHFGGDDAHIAELMPNGIIVIVFGVDDDEPWSLSLDPPNEDGDDDVATVVEGIDDTLIEVGIERSVATPDLERTYSPSQQRDPDGKWGDGIGGGSATGRLALQAAGARLPDRIPMQNDTDAQLTFDGDPGWSAKVLQGTSRAVRLYRNSTYRRINGYLRGDDGDDYIDVRDAIDGTASREHILYDHVVLIDQAMEESPLSRPVQVWRGIHDGQTTFGDAWDPADMVGVEWDELGFPSTTADPQVGRTFGGDVVMRLHVPAGVGAIQLDGWRDADRPNAEAELLLQRNLRMRVVGDTPGSGGHQLIDGNWVDTGPMVYRTLDVEVEVVPEGDE